MDVQIIGKVEDNYFLTANKANSQSGLNEPKK
jgi:hypothetical protein